MYTPGQGYCQVGSRLSCHSSLSEVVVFVLDTALPHTPPDLSVCQLLLTISDVQDLLFSGLVGAFFCSKCSDKKNDTSFISYAFDGVRRDGDGSAG